MKLCKLMALGLAAVGLAYAQSAPKYAVDLTWPKPLPKQWVLGGLGGVCVDNNDHVILLNRQDVLPGDLNSGTLAPPIIEMDTAGNVLHSWGDLKVLDPRLHSCHFDKDNNFWVGSAPSGMIQKYTHDGSKMLLQIGKKGVVDSSDGTIKGKPLNTPGPIFFMPSSIYVDRQNGDVYVSDGEGKDSNKRVAVFDRNGTFLRQWLPEMNLVHCLTIANDGTVYVCNRDVGKIVAYDKTGKQLRSFDIPWTPATPLADGKARDNGGAAVAFDLSHDPAQKWMYLINQQTSQVHIIERETGKIISSFGRIGHYPGEFDQAHGIAVDAKGNVYVAENRGRRIQKFKIVK
jgi:sugar lactone lactonase YvrE